jgi:hypothetical protein
VSLYVLGASLVALSCSSYRTGFDVGLRSRVVSVSAGLGSHHRPRDFSRSGSMLVLSSERGVGHLKPEGARERIGEGG